MILFAVFMQMMKTMVQGNDIRSTSYDRGGSCDDACSDVISAGQLIIVVILVFIIDNGGNCNVACDGCIAIGQLNHVLTATLNDRLASYASLVALNATVASLSADMKSTVDAKASDVSTECGADLATLRVHVEESVAKLTALVNEQVATAVATVDAVKKTAAGAMCHMLLRTMAMMFLVF